MIWKEFCKIIRWTEDNYNPQLDYIEYGIYEVYSEVSVNNYEFQDVICVVMYDLKGYIDYKKYDYSEILDEKLIRFTKELEMLFNPFINEDIKINDMGKNDLRSLFTLPIICLRRIYDSIDF